jgi:putative ATP-dependent endonuclease of OLD family
MTEAFFARVVVIVEGASEREAIPIFARSRGLDFDEHGISIVSAGGKSTIDTLVQLYQLQGIWTYVIFDNDSGNDSEKSANRTMCRLLQLEEVDEPEACVEGDYAILQGNWELQCREDVNQIQLGLYDQLEEQARAELSIAPNRNKPLVARFIAEALVRQDYTPGFVENIIGQIRRMLPDAG